ncbi:LysE family translocator [Chitinivorax sp. B]|uniref:LysE family translocator n=1 Tax=Chitinivorax sp. B TaxID=2502235 RepID=UPI0010F86FFB|nr:LysE family translocator [Chitinivorax sp. B]
MFELKFLITFAVTNFLLNISPGPAVLQVVGHAISNGWWRAQASVLGILAGNVIYCGLSALGLGAILLASPTLFNVIRYAGVAYLIYIGLKRMLSPTSVLQVKAGVTSHQPMALFRQSLVLQISNPKSILFFGAMLPNFIGSNDHAGLRIMVLGLLAIVLEFPILLAYSVVGARIAAVVENERYRRMLDIVCGLLLISAALFVATA